MGKGSSKAPAAPDPYKTAQAEAQFNRVDTYSPSGAGVRYGYTDAKGNFVQGVAPQGQQAAQQAVESPWEKAIREALQPASVNLTNNLIRDNVTNMPGPAQVKDFDKMAQDIFDAGYARMAPQFEQENGRLLSNLQARGIPVGAEAFTEANTAQQQGVNDALQQLSLGAQSQAGAEQSRQYGLDANARATALSEIMAAMGGQYNPPTAAPSGQAQGVNYSQLVGQQYQAQSAQAAQNAQNKQSMFGTLGGLGAAAIMKCSVSFKEVVGPVGGAEAAAVMAALPIHEWRYVDGEDKADHISAMAEDWKALTGLGDGTDINVIDAFGVVMGALGHALREIEALKDRNERLTHVVREGLGIKTDGGDRG